MEFKKNVKIETDDFYYDLFLGGYIKPEKLLANRDDIKRVQDAIDVIDDFYNSAEEADIIVDC
jgi:hypothetical protein